MIVLKALAVLALGLMSFVAAFFMLRQMQTVKVKARSRQPNHQVRRLRQDPRTGVYYPAD